jgi:hypothetical protein
MSSQIGSHINTYDETIDGLKMELGALVAHFRSQVECGDFVRLYRALCTVEDLAGAPRTSLEELLGIAPRVAPDAFRQVAKEKSELALGVQVESEPVAEIEKGA